MARETIQPPSAAAVIRCEKAASLAAVQLDLAVDVLTSRWPNLKGEERAIILAGVLQAVARNYATLSS
jgi:hypothetical protein